MAGKKVVAMNKVEKLSQSDPRVQFLASYVEFRNVVTTHNMMSDPYRCINPEETIQLYQMYMLGNQLTPLWEALNDITQELGRLV
jgi:hypothetical protein